MEQILRHHVPEPARKQTAGYEWTVLASALLPYREAVRLRETYVSLGNDFPRSANDELRDGFGARWIDGRWSVRAVYEAAARRVIEEHRETERVTAERHQAAEVTKREQEKAAGILRISVGEGYGGEPFRVGEVLFGWETVRCGSRVLDRGSAYVVTEASRTYIREDGMSFGVGDESGYIYYATVRPATDEEAAPRRAEAAAAQARRQAREQFSDLFRETFDRGEDEWGPDGRSLSLGGERIEDPSGGQDLVGGGRWVVIETDRIWAVRNNGMDGDNWAANNIRTGGAGGIGRWVPFEGELAEQIRDAARRAGPVERIDALAGYVEPGD